jgi:hypothetical protein
MVLWAGTAQTAVYSSVMVRRLVTCSLVSTVAGCGQDAATVLDAPAIDAPACAAPDRVCGTACVAIESDEKNCGNCDVVCHGGEACVGSCMCPAAYLPSTIEPSGFDQFRISMGITVAVAAIIGSDGITPVLVGYDALTPLNTDIDLSLSTIGAAPFVGSGYRYDPTTMTTDASYYATAGTLRLTKACATEAEGTLTNVTFRGLLGTIGTASIDPLGCSFTISTPITFHIQSGAACP